MLLSCVPGTMRPTEFTASKKFTHSQSAGRLLNSGIRATTDKFFAARRSIAAPAVKFANFSASASICFNNISAILKNKLSPQTLQVNILKKITIYCRNKKHTVQHRTSVWGHMSTRSYLLILSISLKRTDVAHIPNKKHTAQHRTSVWGHMSTRSYLLILSISLKRTDVAHIPNKTN